MKFAQCWGECREGLKMIKEVDATVSPRNPDPALHEPGPKETLNRLNPQPLYASPE